MKHFFLVVFLFGLNNATSAQGVYDTHDLAPDYEWYYWGEDTSSIYMKGHTKYVRGILFRWMKKSNIDSSKPTETIKNNRDGSNKMIWEYENDYDDDVRLVFHSKNDKRSEVVIVITPRAESKPLSK